MTIEIDPDELKKELINIYHCYLSNRKELNDLASKEAQEVDGLWSGDFLLERSIEQAIGGLRYMYLEPKLPKDKARQILQGLEK